MDRKILVWVQIALSSLYILLGENEKALGALLPAKEVAGSTGGSALGMVFGNLAVVRDRMGQYEAAKEDFARSCELFMDCGATRDLALALLNLGVIKLRLQEPLEECAELFQKALECSLKIDSISLQAKALSSLARIDFKQGRTQEAVVRYGQALKLWREDLNIPDCALAILDLAEISLSLGRLAPSAKSVNIAERLEELSNSPFPSQHKVRLDASRDATKPQLSVAEWRSAQRVTKGKSGQELITMAIQMLEDFDGAMATGG